MTPLNIVGPDLIVLLIIVVVLFGGTRLAGIGKGAGRAIREFKQETDSLRTRPERPEQGPETPKQS